MITTVGRRLPRNEVSGFDVLKRTVEILTDDLSRRHPRRTGLERRAQRGIIAWTTRWREADRRAERRWRFGLSPPWHQQTLRAHPCWRRKVVRRRTARQVSPSSSAGDRARTGRGCGPRNGCGRRRRDKPSSCHHAGNGNPQQWMPVPVERRLRGGAPFSRAFCRRTGKRKSMPELELKPLSKDAIGGAGKAMRYRLLNKPPPPEHLCLDIVRADPSPAGARDLLLPGPPPTAMQWATQINEVCQAARRYEQLYYRESFATPRQNDPQARLAGRGLCRVRVVQGRWAGKKPNGLARRQR